MIIRVSAVIILLFQFLFSTGQINTILWQKCLGTEDGYNQPYAVVRSGNGYLFGIYIQNGGPGVSNYHGSGEAWIVNTDSIGNIIWERCYGGSKADGPYKIININDDSFYLLNDSGSDDGDVQNGRSGNFWVVKINSSGDIVWENSYGGSVNGEEVRDAILMPDNGLLLMGRISSTGGDVTTHYGSMDIWFCRIDSCGNVIWGKTYGNQGRDNAIKIKLTSRNTVLMIGGHFESGGMIDCPQLGSGSDDVWIVEMDLYGTLLNQWCYGGTQDDLGWDIVELEDGYAFTACTNSKDVDISGFHGNEWNMFYDIWVVKIDFYGNIIWQKCLGGYKTEFPTYITQTEDYGFIIIGDTWSIDGDVSGNHTQNGDDSDIWVVKVNRDGELEWEHCFGGWDTERFWGDHSVLKKDDYDYVLGAISNDIDGDVECDVLPDPWDLTNSAWLFEIKDCNYYLPASPVICLGPDTLCSISSSISTYSISPVTWATGYEWSLEPANAGTIEQDSLSAYITWDPQFEGPVSISARSFNDCGTSAWSEPHVTQVYTCMGVKEYKNYGFQIDTYPNPACNRVDFNYILSKGETKATITITDLTGKIIDAIQVNGNEGIIKWDCKQVTSGIYFYSLKTSNFLYTGKLIITK